MYKLLKTSLGGLLLALFLMPSLSQASIYYEVFHFSVIKTGASGDLAMQSWCDNYALCTGFTLVSVHPIGDTHTFDVTYNGSQITVVASLEDGTCPIPLVDDGNGVCVEANNCIQGQLVTLSLKKPDLLSICIGNDFCGQASFDGCDVDYNTLSFDCFYNASDNNSEWCNYSGQMTGIQSSIADSPPENTTDPAAPQQSAPQGCSYTESGALVCGSSTDNCGTVNGVDTCVNSQDNCGTVNGKDICANDEKNCGTINGQVSCVQVPPSSQLVYGPQNSAPEGCFQDATGKQVCFNDKVKQQEEKQVVSNPDGSITEITTKTNNIVGSGSTTTTKTIQPDGSASSQITKQGDGGTLDGKGDKPSNSELIKELQDVEQAIKDGQCQGNECDKTAEINQIEADNSTAVDALIADITDDQGSDFGLSGINGFGATHFIDNYLKIPLDSPCSGSIDTFVMGMPFVLAPCEKLQPLRDILAWVFSIFTFFTILNIFSKRSFFGS